MATPDIYRIVSIIQGRREAQGPVMENMREVLKRYGGDYVVPLTQPADAPVLPPLTPMLIKDAIDGISDRAAGTMPSIATPAINPAKQQGTKSREFADIRRMALQATWTHCHVPQKVRQAYRHLAAYTTASMQVSPDPIKEYPTFRVRDPLGSFPDETVESEFEAPTNIGFVYERSGDYLARLAEKLGKDLSPLGMPADRRMAARTRFEMVEWIDGENHVLGARKIADGATRSDLTQMFEGGKGVVELQRWPNRLGYVPVYCPTKVSLGKMAVHLANLIGIVDLQAKLVAIDMIASQKAIFPDLYIAGDSGRPPRLEGGEWKSGDTGQINIVMDGTPGLLRPSPDPNARQVGDRLERNMRVSSGLVPQMGGETYGALRTGRGIDALMSAAVDPNLQGLQESMEAALTHLSSSTLDIYKTYFGAKKFSMYTGRRSSFRQFDFEPDRHVETTQVSVTYSMPGQDVQGMTIVLGQLRGLNAISRHGFAMLHPFIDDPEAELARINEERMEDAMFAGLSQQLVGGQLDPVHAAKIERWLRTGLDVFEATEKADEEVRREQATVPQQPAPETGMAAPPETMPGLVGRPQTEAAANPLLSVQPANPSVDNMRKLSQSLTAPARGV